MTPPKTELVQGQVINWAADSQSTHSERRLCRDWLVLYAACQEQEKEIERLNKVANDNAFDCAAVHGDLLRAQVKIKLLQNALEVYKVEKERDALCKQLAEALDTIQAQAILDNEAHDLVSKFSGVTVSFDD